MKQVGSAGVIPPTMPYFIVKNTNLHAHLEQSPCPPTIKTSLNSMTVLRKDQNRPHYNTPEWAWLRWFFLNKGLGGLGRVGGGMFKRNPHKDSFKRVVCKKPSKPILKELSLQRDIVVSNVSHRSGTPLENSHQQSLTAKKNYHLWIPIQRTTGLNALVFHFHLQLLLSLHTPHSDTWGH